MKRFSSLSALASISVSVGLSLTTASVALAGPPPANDSPAKPVLVAQAKQEKPGTKTVQPSDPVPTEGGGTPPTAPSDPAAPAAEPAPAAAAQPTPTPAITIGTGAPPGADTPATAPADPAKKPAPRPWAGTNVAIYNSVSTATIFKGQQQDYNPTVDSSLWFLPRYSISESFQLRGRLIFNYEYTNSDETQTRNEPRFSDSTLQLFYRKIPELPGGIKPNVALNVTAPTSPESRARTMVVSPGATLQLFKGFEHVLGGEVAIIGSFTYSHPFYRSTTPEVRTPPPYARQCIGGGGCQDQLTGTMNPSDSMLYALILTGEWGKWAPGLAYFGTSSWAYSPKEAANPVDGTPVSSPEGFRPTSVRQTSYFSVWLDYQVNSWLTPEVGYWMSRAVLDEAGQRGNQFFDRYQDMRVYLGANIAIDNIMKALEGGPAEAGIVRAKAKGPIGQF